MESWVDQMKVKWVLFLWKHGVKDQEKTEDVLIAKPDFTNYQNIDAIDQE